ncbi:MAG: hypothetical protein ACKPFF_12335, partial [Planktothrix sp.]
MPRCEGRVRKTQGKKCIKNSDVLGEFLLDSHGHLIIDQDLYNHDGLTQDGIAEAFIEFAKKENLSFFKLSPSVTPFDAVKYQRLMDGLEAVELTLSQVIEEDINLRIDSEFMKKEYFIINSKIKKNDFQLLDYLASKISDGTHFTPKYTEIGIPFLSALNVQENYLNIAENYQFISVDEHKKLYKRCNPETNDILLRKVGVGARLACVVPENIFEFSIFVSVALVKCKVDKINPFFLSTFINTIYGQKQLIRFNKGITQPDLHLEEIRKLKVPIFKSSFQKKIEQIVRYSQKLREVASYLYQETENLLLSELNLKDWQPTEENI